MKKLLVLILGILFFSFSIAAINLNTATQQQLESIKGIGPTKAKAIVDYRAKNGSFKKAEDIENVKGIGAKTFEKIKGDITVSGKTTEVDSRKDKTASTLAPTEKSKSSKSSTSVKKQ